MNNKFHFSVDDVFESLIEISDNNITIISNNIKSNTAE